MASKYLPTGAQAVKMALIAYIVYVILAKFPTLNIASKL